MSSEKVAKSSLMVIQMSCSISSIKNSCCNCYPVRKINELLTWISIRIEKCVLSILRKNFYFGYDALTPTIANDRKNNLINNHEAREIPCQNAHGVGIDTLYIPSTHANRTGNVIVFAETTSYQDRLDHGLPSKYKHFLDRGAAIVLWNPTQLESKQYAQDLLAVLKKLKEQNPDQKITVKGHCATVEPAISAAADLSQELNTDSISLILDRGYADTFAFARSFTFLPKLPCIRRTIQNHFSCDGLQKLRTFPGKIIFIAPQDPKADQITYWAHKNLTYEMHALRAHLGFYNDAFVKLGKASDHWSSWNADEYNQIDAELLKVQTVVANYLEIGSEAHPNRLPLTCFKKTCLPILSKAWC